MTAFISTFAVAIVLANVALQIYGARNKGVPPVIQGRLHLIEGVSVSWHQVVMAGVAIAMLLALGVFLSKTRYGLGISAVPTFILDRRFGISGAHPPESLLAAMREALA